MATSHGIVTQDAVTSDGTQNYTKTSLGTVKGYLMLATEDTPVNTNFDDVQFHIGASDLAAVNGVMAGCNYEDNQATSDAKSLAHATQIVGVSTAGTDTETEAANHNATVTDGIQLDWVTTSTAVVTSAIMFKEGIDDFDVQIPLLNGTGTTSITGVGFNPDIIICVSPGTSSITYGLNQFTGSVVFYKQSTDTYAGGYWAATHNDTTPDSGQYYTTSALGGSLDSSLAILRNEFTLDNFGSDGFDATKQGESAAQATLFISIKLAAGYSASVGTVDAPGSTGVDSTITGLDHTPQIALFSGTGYTAIDAGSTTDCSFYFGACDADVDVVIGGQVEDSGGSTQNTNAIGWHRDDGCIFTHNGVSLRSAAALDSFTSDGVDLNFTTATDIVKIGYLTIGVDATSGSPSRHGARRGVGRGISRGIG